MAVVDQEQTKFKVPLRQLMQYQVLQAVLQSQDAHGDCVTLRQLFIACPPFCVCGSAVNVGSEVH